MDHPAFDAEAGIGGAGEHGVPELPGADGPVPVPAFDDVDLSADTYDPAGFLLDVDPDDVISELGSWEGLGLCARTPEGWLDLGGDFDIGVASETSLADLDPDDLIATTDLDAIRQHLIPAPSEALDDVARESMIAAVLGGWA